MIWDPVGTLLNASSMSWAGPTEVFLPLKVRLVVSQGGGMDMAPEASPDVRRFPTTATWF